MSKVTSKAQASATRKTARAAAGGVRTYRGVVLQKLAVKSRFSEKQVDDAVRAAIAANRHLFTNGS